MREKIVVTAMGAVTPIGIGIENYWNNLISGKSGIARIKSIDPSELPVQIAAEVKDFNPEDYMDKKLVRNTDRFSQFAYIAADEVLKGGRQCPVSPPLLKHRKNLHFPSGRLSSRDLCRGYSEIWLQPRLQ